MQGFGGGGGGGGLFGGGGGGGGFRIRNPFRRYAKTDADSQFAQSGAQSMPTWQVALVVIGVFVVMLTVAVIVQLAIVIRRYKA